MANDVFGRPMNEKPTSFPINTSPLAPNPLAGPQETPVEVGGRINFSPPGESAAFAGGQAESEPLGPRNQIRQTLAKTRNQTTEEMGTLSGDGQLMPQKSVHTDVPRYDR